MRRRRFLGLAGAALVARPSLVRAEAAGFDATALRTAIAAVEARSGGRLGVALVEIGTSRRFAWRGNERFPMCSTFKALLAAAVLQRVDSGSERLDRGLPVAASDILAGSPFAGAKVGGKALVLDLCEAAMTLSDNAAANLLLPSVGGPDGLTRFVRSIGDPVTRLDRTEPALNESAPGDPRDTTTPDAMADSLGALVFGETLGLASRALLVRWLIDSRTGAARLRAGLPADWSVGDKTGAGENGTTNDVATLWPPRGAPLILACYLTGSTLDADGRNAVHADVARAVVSAIG